MSVKKTTKQEIKEKTQVVKKILNIKGGSYEEWLLKNQNEFINDNVSFLIEMASKNEEKHQFDDIGKVLNNDESSSLK